MKSSTYGVVNQLKSEKPQDIDLEIFTKFSAEIEKCFHKSMESIEKNFRDNVFEIKSLFYDKLQ